jgi:hypothetical protein
MIPFGGLKMSLRKILILLIHGFLIWALCGATIGIGRSLTVIETVLIIHAIAAPIFSALISAFYYWKFDFTTPLQTAVIILIVVMVLDAGLVAPLFEKSYKMFNSLIGTWIPFALIFLSSLITGLAIKKVPVKPSK